MKNNNGEIDEYILQIYEQNQKILELLGRVVDLKVLDDPGGPIVDEEKQKNIDKVNNLTARERNIIQLLLEGKFNKQIAYDLAIAVSTVEYHRSNAMKKLEAKNIGQMIKMYLQWEDAQKQRNH